MAVLFADVIETNHEVFFVILTPSSPGERHDHAGTYVNLMTSSPMRSLATRRSGGRGPAKNGLPRPSTMGWKLESILFDKTKVGQASGQLRSGNGDLPGEPSLQATHRRLDVIPDMRGVGADRL